jgi:hypothetical protein
MLRGAWSPLETGFEALFELRFTKRGASEAMASRFDTRDRLFFSTLRVEKINGPRVLWGQVERCEHRQQ